jgi:GGDEF domain-containing protein
MLLSVVAVCPAAVDEDLQVLDKDVSLDQQLTNRRSLKEALDYVTERCGTTIVIDVGAFKKEKINDIEQTFVHMSPAKSMRLGLLLDLLAKQANAACRIRGEEVIIVPLQKNQKSTVMKSSARKWEEATERVTKKLQRTVTFNKGIDTNTPCQDMLEFLSDRYDVAIVIDFSSFRKGNEAIKRDLEDCPVTLSPQRDKLDTVFKSVFKQIAATYEVIDGTIVVKRLNKKDKD